MLLRQVHVRVGGSRDEEGGLEEAAASKGSARAARTLVLDLNIVRNRELTSRQFPQFPLHCTSVQSYRSDFAVRDEVDRGGSVARLGEAGEEINLGPSHDHFLWRGGQQPRIETGGGGGGGIRCLWARKHLGAQLSNCAGCIVQCPFSAIFPIQALF